TDTFSMPIKILPISYTAFSMNANGATISFIPDSTHFQSYSWKFGDGDTSTTVSPAHLYKRNNIYTVTLTVQDSNGCMDSLQELLDITDAAVSYDFQTFNHIFVYPNPAIENAVIQLNLSETLPVKVWLYNNL